MSWFTEILRNMGFGGVLDAVETAEKTPSAANIAGAIVTVASAAPGAVAGAPQEAAVALGDLGTLVGQVAQNKIAQVAPSMSQVSAKAIPDILTAVETAIEGAISKFL